MVRANVRVTHAALLASQAAHLAAASRAHWATFQHGVHDDVLEAELTRLASVRAEALKAFRAARDVWIEAGAPA